MVNKYTATVHRDIDEVCRTIEFVFHGVGQTTPTTWHEPGDSEMEIVSCTKYIYSVDQPVAIDRNFNVDDAIFAVAASELKTLEKVEDELIQELWDNAESDDPDFGDEDYDKDF